MRAGDNPAQCDVWRIVLDVPVTGLETLSQEERMRGGQFFAERDRRRYLNAHAGVRAVLAQYVARAPQTLAFRVNEFGKPALTLETDVQFNLAHSGECALVAITHGLPIGVDVEQIRDDFDALALAARFFAPREIELLRTSPERFFEIWTRKEAWLKAIGQGVSFPLGQCDVTEAQVRFENAPLEIQARDWWVKTFTPISGYMAAVATCVPNITVRYMS